MFRCVIQYLALFFVVALQLAAGKDSFKMSIYYFLQRYDKCYGD